MHPELRVELKRFGLVILPYQQRAWYGELFSMMNKLLPAMTATFFSRSPKLQMQLMLAQNTTWLALLLFFRPFCAVPFKGGPMERFFADVGRGELKAHWSAGNIVEVAMACGSVTISAMGVSVASGETDPAAGSSVFFIQLFVILVHRPRAANRGELGVVFLRRRADRGGSRAGRSSWASLVRMGIIKKRKKDEKKVVAKVKAQKSGGARRWAKLRAESGLSAAANDLRKQPMLVQMAMEAKRRSAHARNVLNRSGSSVSASMSKWINEGRGEKEDEEEDLLPEAPPGKIAVRRGGAKLLIRFSPVFLFVFLAIPIAITSR